MKNDVIVIGGGAAGSMAAGQAAMLGRRVILLEKNGRIGRKVQITGKGRCNVTNACDVNTLISNVPTNGKFLYSAFHQFTALDTIDFFENLGVSLKIERGRRVFPESDQAADIVRALERFVKKAGVEIIMDKADNLVIDNGAVVGVKCRKSVYYGCSVIICTGGLSYPKTGSTGDGYAMAQAAGHTVTPLQASLVPIELNDDFCKNLQGLSLRNVVLTVKDNKTGKQVYSQMGELLFTHFGVSGPLVLSASAHMREKDKSMYSMAIDLKPALSIEQLDARILREFETYKNKNFGNVLKELLPGKLIGTMAKVCAIPLESKIHQITKEQRKNLVTALKNFSLHPKQFTIIEEAVITSGGVNTREVDPKNMQSKIVKGLYFAGEVLDVDAYTGGFNLQIAFSTGYLAGTHAGGVGEKTI